MTQKEMIPLSREAAIIPTAMKQTVMIQSIANRGTVADQELIRTRLTLAQCFKAVLDSEAELRTSLDEEDIMPASTAAVEQCLQALVMNLRLLGQEALVEICGLVATTEESRR